MILFFAEGKTDSDSFIIRCYSHYVDIMSANGVNLPRMVGIVREVGKKPRFDTDEVFFNLSHSTNVIVCGLSHTEIGVDIEKIRPIEYGKFNFIVAENEYEFFEKWTERESYLKLTGQGFSLGLRADIPKDVHFEHFDVLDDYHVCVCAEEQNIMAYQIDAKNDY